MRPGGAGRAGGTRRTRRAGFALRTWRTGRTCIPFLAGAAAGEACCQRRNKHHLGDTHLGDPHFISTGAWDGLYPNLVAQLGSTQGNYVQRLDADAAYLGTQGEKVTDVSQLFGFEVLQANGLNPLTELESATDAVMASPFTVIR